MSMEVYQSILTDAMSLALSLDEVSWAKVTKLWLTTTSLAGLLSYRSHVMKCSHRVT